MTLPPLARLAVVLMLLPEPLAAPQLEPGEAVQVHETPVIVPGTVSAMVAPVTLLGPVLVAVMV